MKKKLSFILFFIVFLGDALYAQCTKPAKPDPCFLHLMLTMYFLYAIRVCPCMAMTSTLD